MRGASGHSVGAVKAAASCQGSRPLLGPVRSPGGGWRRGERASPRSPGKFRKGPAAAPPGATARGTKAKCRLHRASSAHGGQPAARVRRVRGTAGRADWPLPASALCGAAGTPWCLRGGHGGHLSPPPLNPVCLHCCVTGRDKGEGGSVDRRLAVCVGSSSEPCASHLVPRAVQRDRFPALLSHVKGNRG